MLREVRVCQLLASIVGYNNVERSLLLVRYVTSVSDLPVNTDLYCTVVTSSHCVLHRRLAIKISSKR